MMLWAVVVFICHVSLTDAAHSVSKRGAQGQGCPSCQSSPRCAPKYEMIPGHTACMEDGAGLGTGAIEMTDELRQSIVDYHNKLRASVDPPAADMLEIHWDAEIEMIAHRWATACTKNELGNSYHDLERNIPGRFAVGQNLGTGHDNYTHVMDRWFAEKTLYAPFHGKPLDYETFEKVGHYTQMAWSTVGLIGCAAAICFGKRRYVCNYAPSGNAKGFTMPYTVGKIRGEKCGKKTSAGLCDCGKMACETYSTINLTSCSCICKYTESTGGPLCKINCNSNNQSWYCGNSPSYMISDCKKQYMMFNCPYTCGTCPCTAEGYKGQMCTAVATRMSSLNLLFLSLYLPIQFLQICTLKYFTIC